MSYEIFIITCTGIVLLLGSVTDTSPFITGMCTIPVYGRANELYTTILNCGLMRD